MIDYPERDLIHIQCFYKTIIIYEQLHMYLVNNTLKRVVNPRFLPVTLNLDALSKVPFSSHRSTSFSFYLSENTFLAYNI